jgi:hypothetical protein
LHNVLTETPWLGPLLWAALYASDYSLTIACARLYASQDKIVFEGSYEITPFYQAEVDALRRLSPRFVLVWAGTSAYLVLLSSLARSWALEGVYAIALGALILIQLTIHVRHLRNLFLFRNTVLLRGRLEYPRFVVLRASAFEILSFGVLYAFLYALTADLFVLGGAIACTSLALNHYRMSREHESARMTAAR